MSKLCPAIPAIRLIPLPTLAAMQSKGITFEEVVPHRPFSPVRLRQDGICAGVFATPEQSEPIVRQLMEARS